MTLIYIVVLHFYLLVLVSKTLLNTFATLTCSICFDKLFCSEYSLSSSVIHSIASGTSKKNSSANETSSEYLLESNKESATVLISSSSLNVYFCGFSKYSFFLTLTKASRKVILLILFLNNLSYFPI